MSNPAQRPDYLITAVRFKKEKRHIELVKIWKDESNQVSNPQTVPRSSIVSAIERGTSFMTAYDKGGRWWRGAAVETVLINGTKFIRTDQDRIEEDNLGELPEF